MPGKKKKQKKRRRPSTVPANYLADALAASSEGDRSGKAPTRRKARRAGKAPAGGKAASGGASPPRRKSRAGGKRTLPSDYFEALRRTSRRWRGTRTGSATKRVTVSLPAELCERARRAVARLESPSERLSLSELARRALDAELRRLERKHNGGKPFAAVARRGRSASRRRHARR